MGIEFWTDGHGASWVSHSTCCFVAYSGGGSAGTANIRFLERAYQEEVFVRYGGYYSIQAWLPDNAENREIFEALDDYPCFDDELVSEVEMEASAWESWLQSDLVRTLPEFLQDASKTVDLWSAYRNAMDSTNTYPVAEYSGVSVDVDRIQDAFREEVLTLILDGPMYYVDRQKLSETMRGEIEAIRADKPNMPFSSDGLDVLGWLALLDWCEEHGVVTDLYVLRETLTERV